MPQCRSKLFSCSGTLVGRSNARLPSLCVEARCRFSFSANRRRYIGMRARGLERKGASPSAGVASDGRQQGLGGSWGGPPPVRRRHCSAWHKLWSDEKLLHFSVIDELNTRPNAGCVGTAPCTSSHSKGLFPHHLAVKRTLWCRTCQDLVMVPRAT